jgi:hypothetical protein
MFASATSLHAIAPFAPHVTVTRAASRRRGALIKVSASDAGGAPIPASEAKKISSATRVVKRKGFRETMGFAGWAPEIVNGRVAQIAFVAGVGAEIVTGETLPAQFHDHVFSLAFVSTLVFLASFVPGRLAKKYTSEPSTKGAFGPFSPGKELIHGRMAMLGLAAALYLESTTGHAFWIR